MRFYNILDIINSKKQLIKLIFLYSKEYGIKQNLPNYFFMKHFPISRQQTNSVDCGPSCLQMVAKYYGKIHSLQTLRELCQINEFGVSLLNLSKAAESIGFRCINIHATIDVLYKAPLPCIVHWKQHHFVVVYKITSNH